MTVSYNSSNAKTHLKGKHKDVLAMASDISTVTNSLATAKSVTSLKQNKMYDYKNDLIRHSSPSVCLSYLYKFFNEANIAIEQANNPNLKQFIDLLLDCPSSNKAKRQEYYFSRYKYKKLELDSFTYFINSVKSIVLHSKNYYKDKLKVDSTPFLNVSHDGWNSKDNDILGVSIHLVVPGYWNVMNLAIGLKRVTSKKSLNTATAILIILER